MQLKHASILIFSSVMMPSCATLLTKKTYDFDLHYAQQHTKIRYKDSVYTQPAAIKVRRSKERLVFTAFNDSVQRRYEIRATLNPMFVWGNLSSPAVYPVAPIVYAVDLTTPKRFHYGDHLMIRLNDTSAVKAQPSVGGQFEKSARERQQRHFREQYPRQGDTYLTVSGATASYSASFPEAGRKTGQGGPGITIGAEHYYKDQCAYGITVGASIAYADGIEAFFEKFGPYTTESLSSVYADLYRKHTINRFSLAYGLNYAFNTWSYTVNNDDGDIRPIINDSRTFTNHSFGLMFSGYYHIKPFLQVGVAYRPTFLRVYPDTKGIYQHTVSLHMAFAFSVKRKK